MTAKLYTPAIIVDLAKDRIRIYRSTINALQNPTHILLIVNPIDKTIGIIHGKEGDLGAHKVKISGRSCYELYSRPLTQKFRQVCPDWIDTGKYKLIGKVIPGELVAEFNMLEAEFTGIGKVT